MVSYGNRLDKPGVSADDLRHGPDRQVRRVRGMVHSRPSREEDTMTPQGERLLAALESEIKSISKLEHELARTKILLREQVTRLRLGTNPELVLTGLRLNLPHERTLALLERVDPVLSTPAEPQGHGASEARNDDSGAAGGRR
jgi:hypothetical protein